MFNWLKKLFGKKEPVKTASQMSAKQLVRDIEMGTVYSVGKPPYHNPEPIRKPHATPRRQEERRKPITAWNPVAPDFDPPFEISAAPTTNDYQRREVFSSGGGSFGGAGASDSYSSSSSSCSDSSSSSSSSDSSSSCSSSSD